MRFHTTMVYPAGPSKVSAMFADPVFVKAKMIATGALSHQFDITPGADHVFRVTTRRSMPNDDIPANLRSFVGSTLEIRTVEAWESPNDEGLRSGTMSIEVVGAPVRLVATVALTTGDNGSTIATIDGELRATIPLFGSMVEELMSKALLTAAAQEQAVGIEYLTGA